MIFFFFLLCSVDGCVGLSIGIFPVYEKMYVVRTERVRRRNHKFIRSFSLTSDCDTGILLYRLTVFYLFLRSRAKIQKIS